MRAFTYHHGPKNIFANHDKSVSNAADMSHLPVVSRVEPRRLRFYFHYKHVSDRLNRKQKSRSSSAKRDTVVMRIRTWGAVVEDVRIVFERLNDTTIYIPDVRPNADIAATAAK